MNTGQRVNEAIVAAVLIVGVFAFFMSPLPGLILAQLRALVGRYVTIPAPAPGPTIGGATPAGGTVSGETETGETVKDPIATQETTGNGLLQGKAEALAALVAEGKVTETDGLRIVFGVSPGKSQAYRAAHAALKAAQAARGVDPRFPALTADGRPVAAALRTKAR